MGIEYRCTDQLLIADCGECCCMPVGRDTYMFETSRSKVIQGLIEPLVYLSWISKSCLCTSKFCPLLVSEQTSENCYWYISEQKWHTIQHQAQVQILVRQVKFMDCCPAYKWSKSMSVEACYPANNWWTHTHTHTHTDGAPFNISRSAGDK